HHPPQRSLRGPRTTATRTGLTTFAPEGAHDDDGGVVSVRPQVVIVGAGFGGLSAARGLAGEPVDITIVDRNNFHTFQPLLYQVASAGLDADDIAHNVRGVF